MWFKYQCENTEAFYRQILTEIKTRCSYIGNDCKGCMFYSDSGCFFIDDIPERWDMHRIKDGKEQHEQD